MEKQVFHLLKPIKVIQLGPERKPPLGELPRGAKVRILREFPLSDSIDIGYDDERYFALKSELFLSSAVQDISTVRTSFRKKGERYWFWPLLVMFFSIAFRSGRDALVSLFSQVSSKIDL